MKELSIEEKAKAYDEAIKQIKECTPDENGFITIYPQEIFPELKESEDERIRIELLNYLYDVHDDDEERARWVAYLEKQGEQNPAWSDEDENIRLRLIDYLYGKSRLAKDREDGISWLEFLKDRVQPQPMQEWSEEDKETKDWLIEYFKYRISNSNILEEKVNCKKALNWIESLHPQKKTETELEVARGEGYKQGKKDGLKEAWETAKETQWKPSEEQLKALKVVVGLANSTLQRTLESLYEQLKNLEE